MQTPNKKVKYPENLYLEIEVFKDPRTQQEIADAIGFSRNILNQTIKGKYKGENVVPKLLENLAAQKSNQTNNSK